MFRDGRPGPGGKDLQSLFISAPASKLGNNYYATARAFLVRRNSKVRPVYNNINGVRESRRFLREKQ